MCCKVHSRYDRKESATRRQGSCEPGKSCQLIFRSGYSKCPCFLRSFDLIIPSQCLQKGSLSGQSFQQEPSFIIPTSTFQIAKFTHLIVLSAYTIMPPPLPPTTPTKGSRRALKRVYRNRQRVVGSSSESESSSISSDSSDDDDIPARTPRKPTTPTRARAASLTPRSAAKGRKQRPNKAGEREVPCLGCLNSALSGQSDGSCHDAATGKRCWRCASGHTCEAL